MTKSDLYSTSSPDFDQEGYSTPPRTRKGSSGNNNSNNNNTRGQHRGGSLQSFFESLMQPRETPEDDLATVSTASMSTISSSPSSSSSSSSPKTPSTSLRSSGLYPNSEKRLLQAHDLTRALFACLPCQMMGSSQTSRKMAIRPGIGSYYLPSDLMDESEILPYCGVEVDEAVLLEQNYDITRV